MDTKNIKQEYKILKDKILSNKPVRLKASDAIKEYDGTNMDQIIEKISEVPYYQPNEQESDIIIKHLSAITSDGYPADGEELQNELEFIVDSVELNGALKECLVESHKDALMIFKERNRGDVRHD